MSLRTDLTEPVPDPEPPSEATSAREWLKENLFSSAANGIVTVVMGLLLGWVLYRAGRFVFVTGRWEIIETNITNLLVGLFPRDELWRPWMALYLLGSALGLRAGIPMPDVAAEGAPATPPERARGPATRGVGALRRLGPVLLLLVVLLAFTEGLLPKLLVAGWVASALFAYLAGRRLPSRASGWANVLVVTAAGAAYAVLAAFGGVGWDRWGGLLLTMLLAVAGIVLSFPLGILLALGRRSTLPVVRALCVLYIEAVRGVPLITLLFMGAFVLGFFLPRHIGTPSLVTRAIVVLVLFTAAYIAEVVRGGLQAVPRGQYEAAMAVGLSPAKSMRLIVLPQALRAVIPAIVGQFISLFKDTSLVAIIGLSELLRIAQSIPSQPAFLAQDLQAETLLFASFVYWVGAYSMSRASQRLERRLGVGHR